MSKKNHGLCQSFFFEPTINVPFGKTQKGKHSSLNPHMSSHSAFIHSADVFKKTQPEVCRVLPHQAWPDPSVLAGLLLTVASIWQLCDLHPLLVTLLDFQGWFPRNIMIPASFFCPDQPPRFGTTCFPSKSKEGA